MNLFEDIKWPDGESLASKWRARCASGVSFKNCYVGLGGAWMVKLFLGGSQRLLASSHSGVNAARFADMALVYFHPYRQRRIRPLIDSDLNFNVAQAESDMKNVPEARKLLEDFERALITRHLIPALPTPPAGEPAMRDDVLRANMHLEHQKMSNLFSHFKAKFGSHPMAKLHVDEFERTMGQLRIQIRSLDTFFIPQPTNTNVTTTPTTNEPIPAK